MDARHPVVLLQRPALPQHHHTQLTFGLLYAWSEQYVLPLCTTRSCTEGLALGADAGDRRGRRRPTCARCWPGCGPTPARSCSSWAASSASPASGATTGAWTGTCSQTRPTPGIQALVRTLNKLYVEHPALHAQEDRPEGFRWIQADSASSNVYAFLRFDSEGRAVACLANLANQPWPRYRFGLPTGGTWQRILDTDAAGVGGHDRSGPSEVTTEALPWDGLPASVALDLPPLTVQWLSSPHPSPGAGR